MKKVDWQIVDVEDNKAIVEFTFDSIVNKIAIEWLGDEKEFIKRVDEMALNILDEIDRKVIIDENTKRKLLPLKGSKNIDDVIQMRKNKLNDPNLIEEEI